MGLLCTLVEAPPPVAGPLVAGAGALPAAIEYSLRGRRRNVTEDISRIRQGELRRPVSLVVKMLAAALLLVDSIIGAIFGSVMVGIAISDGTAQMLGWFATLVAAVGGLLVSSYASHYLGKRPYMGTAVAVGAVFVLRIIIILLVFGVDPILAGLDRMVEGFLILLVACEAGAWFGRRHHDKFLAKKLARIEHKASRKTPPPVPAAQASPSPDLLDQLKKLADLKEAGVLTEEEFQTKKTAILSRI